MSVAGTSWRGRAAAGRIGAKARWAWVQVRSWKLTIALARGITSEHRRAALNNDRRGGGKAESGHRPVNAAEGENKPCRHFHGKAGLDYAWPINEVTGDFIQGTSRVIKAKRRRSARLRPT